MGITNSDQYVYDLFVIGGGVNGTGIARDAAGRGLSVCLAEKTDLASATSSASTKLFHGGLRYLEYFEFRLVREALVEREQLLVAMPHISWPMRFVLPYSPKFRFENTTPTSRLVNLLMPWLKGRRPAWLIRLGLFLYDRLGGRKILPATRTIDLKSDVLGSSLRDEFELAYEYSDCWVEDSRLVALNARDASERGATILTRTEVVSMERVDGIWAIVIRNPNGELEWLRARGVVNAAGQWVESSVRNALKTKLNVNAGVRLVKGSHVVVKKLYEHDRCYFFQGTDGRIMFAIPYEQDFTLLGTTDVDHPDPNIPATCSDEERDYLLKFASKYFKKVVSKEDVVWTYSGIRPLYDDGADSATAATRDYVLKLDHHEKAAPILNIFGGKITTYRKLAESALKELKPFFKNMTTDWTAGVPLPGGNFQVDEFDNLVQRLHSEKPFLGQSFARRLVRAYGLDAFVMLADLNRQEDLGLDFGATLTECEVRWLIEHEFVTQADDVIWRRTKLGLKMTNDQIQNLEQWFDTTAFKTAS